MDFLDGLDGSATAEESAVRSQQQDDLDISSAQRDVAGVAELDFDNPLRRSRKERWLWLNLAAALALLVLLFIFDVGLYLRFLRLGAIGALGLFVALPVLAWWIFRNRERESARVVWAVFAAVLLLGLATAAIFDAQQFQYHNCWVLNEQSNGSQVRHLGVRTGKRA